MLKQIPEIYKEILRKISLWKVAAASLFALGFSAVAALADTPAVPGGSAAPAGSSAPEAPGFSSMIVPFAAMFAVVYFLMIRPQQKKMKEQQAMLSQLKPGDEVVTTSGILGKITQLSDKIVTVEVADKVRIRILRSQISQLAKGDGSTENAKGGAA